MLLRPPADILLIEHVAGDGEEVDDVVEILAPGPAQLLDHDILRRRHPGFPIAFGEPLTTAPREPFPVVGVGSEVEEFDVEAFRLTVEVNLTGTMRMCVATRPLLAATRGAIINTASMLTFQGSPFVPGYAASKGGVGQLTKSLAAAWAHDGIRVNAIAPGWIETDLTRPLVEDQARSAPILARTPLGRWGKPDDIGGVAVFLASDEARFVTGAIIPIDGGYLAV